MNYILQFERVGLRYGLGPEVLQDISFRLKPGSFHFLIGPSGAGKSSLLKLMYLALRPSRGLVHLFGQDISTLRREDTPELRRNIGVVFQEFRLLSHLSAFDNVALPLRITKIRETKIRKHVEELLAWVGLEDHMDSRPHTLSGGQQQRVAIARAVISGPKILYADEPTGNVDSQIAARILYLFEELNKTGTTVLVATHNETILRDSKFPIMTLKNGKLRVNNPNG